MRCYKRFKNTKSLLVTGGAGFIGSHFIKELLKAYPHIHIVNLDLLTYAGSLENVKGIPVSSHFFVKGDICDKTLVETLFEEYSFDAVVHFAAESHVDNSINDAYNFIKTNVLGTQTLLEVSKNTWESAPEKLFFHVSTDEVYGPSSSYLLEKAPYNPTSPYAASKAASDHLVSSYHKTYGLPTVITNASNTYGTHQHQEKFIPTIIHAALSQNPIPIYGTGENKRSWLHVKDHCRAIMLAFDKAPPGSQYNISSTNTLSNIELARNLCKLLDKRAPLLSQTSYLEYLTYVSDRLGHDSSYLLSSQKALQELGWEPQEAFEKSLDQIIVWQLHLQKHGSFV